MTDPIQILESLYAREAKRLASARYQLSRAHHEGVLAGLDAAIKILRTMRGLPLEPKAKAQLKEIHPQ